MRIPGFFCLVLFQLDFAVAVDTAGCGVVDFTEFLLESALDCGDAGFIWAGEGGVGDYIGFVSGFRFGFGFLEQLENQCHAD